MTPNVPPMDEEGAFEPAANAGNPPLMNGMEEETEGEAKIISNGASPPDKNNLELSNISDETMDDDELNDDGTPKNGEGKGGEATGEYEEEDGQMVLEAADMEGVLEGIVGKDGQMEVEEDDQYLTPDEAPAEEATHNSHRKMAASKSIGKASSLQKTNDNDMDTESKKMSLEQFQNGSLRPRQIKTSKMTKLKQARQESNNSKEGTAKEAIVLLDSDDDDEKEPNDSSSNLGMKQDDDDEEEVGKEPSSSGSTDTSNKPMLLTKSGSGWGARDIEVGERVYCEYSIDKFYYWGHIVRREKKKKSRFYMYDVRFDDGDEDFDVSSTKMTTVSEYIAQFGEEKYRSLATNVESPAGYQELADRMNPAELLKNACGTCENCVKPSCGSCGSCKVNRFGNDARCCFQKMCCRIPEQKKLQALPGLPEGTGFCFQERKANPQYEGLLFVTKKGRRYRSFESCFFGNRQSQETIDKLYSSVGLAGRNSRQVVSERTGGQKPMTPMTPHEMWEERCGTCKNCVKPDCNLCICCRGNKRDPTARNCCFRKMCLAIDLVRRAQNTHKNFGNFPEGWTFAFDEIRSDVPHLDGLVLFPPPPNTRKYASVDRAVNHNKTALSNVKKQDFYQYVGLPPDVPEQGFPASNGSKAAGQAKRPSASNGFSVAKKARVVAVDVPYGLSLRKLYERRCKACTMCVKPSCNRCRACKDNVSQTRAFKDVCLQKMCCEIKQEDLLQPAKGFPDGWRFFYTDPKRLDWLTSREHTGSAGLVLVSPTGRKFSTVESTAVELDHDDDVNTIARTFYAHAGCHAVVTLEDHILLGRDFCQRWVDVEGKVKMAYGKVIDVTEDLLSGGIRTCIVEFSDKSRSLLNSGITPNGVSVPATQNMPQTLAFGGCLACDPRAVRIDMMPYHLSWNVPDVRHEDFVVDEHGMFSPRLTMHFRGFHLTLTAKTSTIPNAGKGVFVSATTLTGSNDVFVLTAGELLDLGVYAPFRRRDKKSAHVFLMKNFLHSEICEEWNFDTVLDDNLFDITDDCTGKRHEIAARHIPSYVNETNGHCPASVFAQHDPEGCVHYLLGHGCEKDGPFTLPANGVEREIFIDYGETYEDVRVRKHYSRLSDEDADKRRRELDLDYREILEEISTYNATEITQCLNFMMRDVFYPNRKYPASLVLRALLVTVLFRRQAESFLEDFAALPVTIEEEEETASVCKNGFSRDRMEMVIHQSQNLIKTLFRFCNSWHEIKSILLSNDMYLACLEMILGKADYDAMAPEKLGELMLGDKERECFSG